MNDDRRDLSIGMVGEDVKLAQAQLNALGDYMLATDGVFDSTTLIAVQHFQLKSGLDDDGIIGPLTREALGL